ncbi:MAG: LytTR family DNA-binding domain-containing protein [Bacteroidota bacterium]
MKKVIIVDDESSARSLIKEYLEDYPDCIVMQECNNGVDAVKSINMLKPDLVFLDIQMPGFNGFEVIEKLDKIPQIIFTTAYDEYALQAFDVHAVDYLLKPIKQERFDEAMVCLAKNRPAQSSRLEEYVSQMVNNDTYLDKLLIWKKGKLIKLATEEIVWIKADGNYAKIMTTTQTLLSSMSLKNIELKLHPHHFIKVHRSAIVNIDAIKELYRHQSSFQMILSNGDVVKVSRSYTDDIKKRII